MLPVNRQFVQDAKFVHTATCLKMSIITTNALAMMEKAMNHKDGDRILAWYRAKRLIRETARHEIDRGNLAFTIILDCTPVRLMVWRTLRRCQYQYKFSIN